MPNQTLEVHTERAMAAPPEQVFDAWLDAEAVRSWMRTALRDFGLPGDVRRVEIDPRVGGSFVFSDVREGGEAVHWGRYRVLERPSRIVFTWFTSEEEEREDASTVTLTLEPEGPGCRATVSHELDAGMGDYAEATKAGWTQMLIHIDRWLADLG